MSSVNFVVSGLIEKMSSSDKDFRYMATNDLMNELKKESFRVDAQTETKMVNGVLKLLEDNNGEVQNLVVKCLPLMVNTITEAQLDEVLNKLCNHLSGKEELRDIASIGLKSVIVEIPSTSSVVGNLCKRLSPKLLLSIKNEGASYEVKMDALDLLTELLSRFGALMIPFHQEILDALLLSLAHPRPAIRKRTTGAIGHLVKHLNDKQFQTLVAHVSSKFTSGLSAELTRSYISCLAVISRYVGKRLSKNLNDLTPILLSFLDKNDDELRESCFQTIEYLVLQCQSEAAGLIPKAMEKSLELIKYDPNYVDDDNEDEEMEEEEEEEEEGEGEYSDDDDMSWKVRRAASRTLAAIIFTRSELLPQLMKSAAPIIISRFGEREENVRIENFHTFMALLRRVASITKQQRSIDPMETSDGLLPLLRDLVPKITKALLKSLKDKSQKTKQTAFSILKELILVLGGGLATAAPQLAQPIATTLSATSSSSGLKIEILSFAGVLFKYHSIASFSSLLKTLVPPIIKATQEKYYKVASEALTTSSELIQSIRPLVPQPAPLPEDLVPFVNEIYSATLKILGVQDVDQEVKEKAIICLGQIVSHTGDTMVTELGKSLPILQEKISNEITRLMAVKTLTLISRSPLNINLSPIIELAVADLSSFLRKANRSLKLSSLICLNTLIVSRGQSISQKQIGGIIAEAKTLLNDSDLQILPLALNLLNNSLKAQPASLASIKAECFGSIFSLIRSPLLQGTSLKALLELFGTIVATDAQLFNELLNALFEPLSSKDNQLTLTSSKQPFFSIAQTIGAICQHSPANTSTTVQRCAGLIKETTTDSEKYLGLLALGEIGKLSDLGSSIDVYGTVLSYFSNPSEEVKSAAAYSLGNIAVGNLGKYVPLILQEIKQNPKKQYLLLHSLKEIIAQEAQKDNAKNLIPFAEEIWSILFNNCESEEEGTRNAVAECLGKLTMINPQKYLPELQKNLASASAFTRATCVIATKFTFSSAAGEQSSLFKSMIETFVPLIKDSDLIVRRVSLQALNSAALHKPAPVSELLPSILPLLYEATVVQKELIKIVTMGPFKYEVDEGLDARKAAFEVMLTLLTTCPDVIGIFDFMERVLSGLQDKFDIKILSHITLQQLCSLAPNAVLQKIEEFVTPLEATINHKLKENAVKQEIEKNEELVRSSLRAVVALSKLPEADANPRFAAFYKLLQSSDHRAKLEAVISEVESRETGIDSMDTS